MEKSVETYSIKLSRQMATLINIVLLITHIFFITLFIILQVHMMVYVNVLSISIYVSLFLLLKKDKIPLYLNVVYIEIVVHMSLATIAMGWDCGYQVYCFSAIPVIYYCDYLGKYTGRNIKIRPNIVAGFIAVVYIALRLYCNWAEPMYELEPQVCQISFIMNSAYVFAFLAYYMSSYGKINTESASILQNQAEEDQLTEIGNRYYMNRFLEKNYQEVVKSGNKMAVAILDIDDFKQINDTYGHDFGDVVLQDLAAKLKKMENDNVKICRWGGEEFLVLSMEPNGKEDLRKKLELLMQQVRNSEIEFNGVQAAITVTAGVSEHHQKDKTFNQMIKRADQKLYEGKESGKNKIVC